MEVARTSMIHAAAPHFLWPFAVRYAAHQLNLRPRVSWPETSPTLRWTGKVGDASVFWVWGSCAFVHDTSADKLSARAIPCVFLGFVPDVPGWQLYHPTSRRVLPSQDVTFDESVPFYRLFPYRSAPPPPPSLFLALGPPPVLLEVLRLGVLPLGGAEPRGAGSEGAGSGGAEPGGEEPWGAEPEGVERGGAEAGGAEYGGAEPWGAASSGGAHAFRVELPGLEALETVELDVHELLLELMVLEVLRLLVLEVLVPGVLELETLRSLELLELEALALVAPELEELDFEALVREALELRELELLIVELGVLAVPTSSSLTPPLLCPPPDQSQLPLLSPSSLPAPSPYTEQSGGLTERREPASHPVSPIRIARRVPRSLPPPVPGTHAMALRPSSVPLRVPLPAPPESSLRAVLDPESDRARAASPTVSCLFATAVSDPSFESATASALVAELLDFAAACRLDYATALVAESASANPPSIGGECALGTDVLEDRQEDFECPAAAVPRFASMLLAPERDPDALDIPTPRSYAEAIMGPYSVEGNHGYRDGILEVHRDLRRRGSPTWGEHSRWHVDLQGEAATGFSACLHGVLTGFSQRQGVDYFQTLSPTSKMTTLRVLLHVAAQRDYELHSLDFSTAFLQGSLHKEIWLRRPPSFTGSFPVGTQWSLRQPVYGLRQAPREWHDTMRTILVSLGFAPSTADPSLFLRTDTSLPPFYVLVYIDDLVFATADTGALTLVKSELQKRHTCTDLGELRSYLGLQITRDRERHTITLTQSHMVHQVLQRFGF
ncbi:unnamed protein product [Closterium sp. NIES-54]